MTESVEFKGNRMGPELNKIQMEDPWRWLSAGWQDFVKNLSSSLAYGAVFSVITALISLTLILFDQITMFLILAAGFMLIAPIFAVGLYEASRCLEEGESFTFKHMITIYTRAPIQLAYLGLVLCSIFMIWIRIATLIYALFFGTANFPPMDQVLSMILNSSSGAWMLAVGTLVGAGFAAAVFAVSAISIPLLMRRDVDFITAVVTSIRAVIDNLKPMLLWAWLIMLFTTFGMATMGVGMLVVYPLIGHATWHAYRALVPKK